MAISKAYFDGTTFVLCYYLSGGIASLEFGKRVYNSQRVSRGCLEHITDKSRKRANKFGPLIPNTYTAHLCSHKFPKEPHSGENCHGLHGIYTIAA